MGNFLWSPAILEFRKKVVEVIDENIVSSKKLASFIEFPETPLLTSLRTYVNNETYSDITLKFLGKEFFLHKIILLVRTPEFLDLLQRKDPTIEKLLEGFSIDEILLFLTLIYTGEVYIANPDKMRSFISKIQRLRTELPMAMFPSEPLTECLRSTQSSESRKIRLKEEKKSDEPPADEDSTEQDKVTVESSDSTDDDSAASEFEVLAPLDRLVLPTSADFRKALDNPSFADVTLVTSDEVEFANLHRVILAAQSDYFKVLFSSRWQRGTPNKHTEQIEARLLANVLHVIYSNDLARRITTSTVVDMLLQSEYFLLDRLRGLCESFIASRVNRFNIQTVHELAYSIQSRRLTKACEYYASQKGIVLDDHSGSVDLINAPSGRPPSEDLLIPLEEFDEGRSATVESYLTGNDSDLQIESNDTAFDEGLLLKSRISSREKKNSLRPKSDQSSSSLTTNVILDIEDPL
jgi:hypothetical protein